MTRLLLLTFLSFSFGLNAQEQTLNLSSDIWPPFTNVEGEKAISLDIVKEALDRIDITVKYNIQDSVEIMSAINEGVYDGSAALWISEERKGELVFSEPYLQNQLILVGRKGSNVDVSSVLELGETRIGIVEGYAYGKANAPNVEFIRGKNDQQNLERLMTKKVDYIVIDALLIQYMLKYQINDVSALLEIASSPLRIKTLHFALSKNVKDAEEIMAKFNEEIKKMVADGTYHDILELNWIRVDVDGDGKYELVLEGDQAGLAPPSSSYDVFYSSEGGSDNRFYINGKVYESWDEVPDELKTPIPKPDPTYRNTGGFILNF